MALDVEMLRALRHAGRFVSRVLDTSASVIGGEFLGGDMRIRKSGVESQKLNTARDNIAFESADLPQSPRVVLGVNSFCEIRPHATKSFCS